MASTLECQHDGYHRDAIDLAACLRERLDLYREKDSELRLIRAALGIEEGLDKARAVGYAGLVMAERGESRRVAAALRVALPTSESGAQTMVETVIRQRDELRAGLARAVEYFEANGGEKEYTFLAKMKAALKGGE